MKRIVIWFVGVATLMPILLGPKSAYAWNDESHDLLSRESILFMLRSGDPSVRLAGAMLVSAGEGSRANADGTRAWRLSREAFNVDHYEDVAMHNTADTPVLPELVYQLFGQVNFTAYDHFLLWGKNTTGQSIEKYNHVVRMPNGEFETVKDFMRMEQHDDIPGYTLSADDSLRGGVSPTLDLAGQWIQRVGSSGFQKFCDKQVRELVKKAPAEIGSFLVDKIPVPYLGDVLKWVFSEVPGISDLASLLGDEIARAVGPKLAAWVSAMCPRMVGDWDESPALADLRINHSTIDRTDIDGIAMMDIRFHPADNLATLGVNRLRDARDFDPKQQFLRKGVIAKACKPRGGRGSDDGIGRTALCDRVLARETARAARLARARYGESNVYRRGNLIQLGRLIHAIADVAVPGHVSGRLLHPEHLVMEGGAESFLDDFITYARNREQTSVTGAIQPTYARSGDTVFELNGLVDTAWIEEKVERIVGNSDDFQQKSIELLTEDAAFRTFAEAQRRRMLGQFDPPDGRIAPEVRRAFLSRAMLNIILGSTRAMQMFYGDQSSRTWDQMTQRVTWTARDLALRAQQPARGRRVTSPRVELPTYSRARQSYTGNVDAFYQEWQEIDGCYVESHNWNPATGPTFVNTLELGAEVQLSPANRGIKGDRIHVTGAYSAGKTHISYFNDHLADSAGRTVRIPAGALSEGVAVWCTGPDIWNTGRHEEDGQGETGSICDIAEIRPTGGLACNFAESLRFRPRAQSVGGVVLPGTTGGRGAGGGSAPIRVTPIVAVAKQIKVSPRVLTTAVASAGNNKTTLVYPSAIGKAEISWNDKKSGLSSHVVISRTGRVTLKRTATRQLKALR